MFDEELNVRRRHIFYTNATVRKDKQADDGTCMTSSRGCSLPALQVPFKICKLSSAYDVSISLSADVICRCHLLTMFLLDYLQIHVQTAYCYDFFMHGHCTVSAIELSKLSQQYN